jgi:hypothetical protein
MRRFVKDHDAARAVAAPYRHQVRRLGADADPQAVWRWSTQPRQFARAQLIRSKFEGSATFARVFRFLWVRAASSCAFRAAPSAQKFAEQ